MHQLTLRIPDELGAALKRRAGGRGESVNAYATAVLSAAVDPDLEEDDLRRLRARLAEAGLLEQAPTSPRERPPADRVRAARRRAGTGRPLSEIVREERG